MPSHTASVARAMWRGRARMRKQRAETVGGGQRERHGGLVASRADAERDAVGKSWIRMTGGVHRSSS
jgi:hypothetical protein